MGLLTAQQSYKLIDQLALAFAYIRGASGSPASGVGDGSWGMSLIGGNIRALCEGSADSTFADADLQAAIGASSRGLSALATYQRLYANSWGSWIQSLDAYARGSSSISSTITNLDTFMLWWNIVNASSYWNCLAPPEWRFAYNSSLGAAGNTYPDPRNVYLPIKQGQAVFNQTTGLLGAASTNGAGKRVITSSTPAAFVQGEFANPTKFAGGSPRLKWSAGAGSGAFQINVDGLDQTGAVEQWRYTGTTIGASSSGQVLTPQNRAYSLMSKCTGISFVSGVTDGTFYAEIWEPTGRTWPLPL